MKIKLKRVYENPSKDDGTRLLIDRLWPRGIKKENLKIDAWLKQVAPSTDLRKWYSHDLEKWPEFKKKYAAELKEHPEVLKPIKEALKKGTVTLLFSSKEVAHNHATFLKEYLEK